MQVKPLRRPKISGQVLDKHKMLKKKVCAENQQVPLVHLPPDKYAFFANV